MRLRLQWLTLILSLLLGFGATGGLLADSAGQVGPTATPAQVDLFNSGASIPIAGDTPTPTRTATPPGPVQLEAIEVANVRAQPDTSAELLGEIRTGEYYNVIRRYYSWVEFQYDPSPTRRGWVFGELVRFIGDESAILVVESLDATAPAVEDFDVTSTGLAVTQTPGGLLTATALARVSPAAPVVAPGDIAISAPQSGNLLATEEVREALPTFTYPPGIIPLAPTQPPAVVASPTPAPSVLRTVETGRFPPVLAIFALTGAGLLGLLVSSARR